MLNPAEPPLIMRDTVYMPDARWRTRMRSPRRSKPWPPRCSSMCRGTASSRRCSSRRSRPMRRWWCRA
ncbi:hypothetical protein ACU4GD_08455 [Cupriavidus basilensis]